MSEGLVSREEESEHEGWASDAKGMWAQGRKGVGRAGLWGVRPSPSSYLQLFQPSPLDVWAASGQEEGEKDKNKTAQDLKT